MVLYRFNNFNGRNIRLNGGNMTAQEILKVSKVSDLLLEFLEEVNDSMTQSEIQALADVYAIAITGERTK